MKTALISLQSLLFDPAPNDPQDAQVAKHYLSDRAGFEKTAREWTLLHASQDSGVNAESVRRLCDMGFRKKILIHSKGYCNTGIKRI